MSPSDRWSAAAAMRRRDVALLLAVAIVWGVNFTVIKIGLRSVPPLFLVFLRYLIVVFPLIFFVRRPDMPWGALAGYGLCLGVGQFSFLFYSIRCGMPAGLASVVLQAQAVFTLILSAIFMRERIGGVRLAGVGLSVVGLGLIGGFFDPGMGSIPPAAFLMCLLAAFFWGSANVILRKAVLDGERGGKSLDMMGVLVWASAFVPLPMLGIALAGDGPAAILRSVTRMDSAAVFSVLYLVVLSTLFSYYVWNRMIATYSAGRVAPFSFLVPITGLLSATLVLGERIEASQWLGIAAVIVGLGVFQFGGRFAGALVRRNPPLDEDAPS